MKRIHRFSAAGCIAIMMAICSSCSPKMDPDLHVSAETLVGQWRASTKSEAIQPGGSPSAESFAGDWVFKSDHGFEAKAMFGDAPATWQVVNVGRNTLTFELTCKDFPARGTVTFKTTRECIVSMGQGGPDEVFALSK